STLKPVSTGGDLKTVTRRTFIFIAPDKILSQLPSSVNDLGIFSFPQGKRLAKFPMSANELKLTGNTNYVIVKPVVGATMGIFDLTKGALVSGMNKNDATFWNDLIIYELISGSVTISQTKYDEETKILKS